MSLHAEAELLLPAIVMYGNVTWTRWKAEEYLPGRPEMRTLRSVFWPGLKNDTVLLEGKGHFRACNYILRGTIACGIAFLVHLRARNSH